MVMEMINMIMMAMMLWQGCDVHDCDGYDVMA